jgi:hypothetical protein
VSPTSFANIFNPPTRARIAKRIYLINRRVKGKTHSISPVKPSAKANAADCRLRKFRFACDPGVERRFAFKPMTEKEIFSNSDLCWLRRKRKNAQKAGH